MEVVLWSSWWNLNANYSGEAFKTAFAAYATPQLTKGIPSLFNGVKPLYKDEAKVKVIEECMLQIKDNLKTIGKYKAGSYTINKQDLKSFKIPLLPTLFASHSPRNAF